ncbi:MAG: DNA adenine methylase [Cardiobacteriaceae bacterium]|nr:DNA adenine methylase [Cardiobacteriaceae bacterium]
MNYIGSKLSLLNFIESGIKSCVGSDLSNYSFCDGFAGTGVVGAHFKQQTKQIIANDNEYYSFILNKNLICNNFDIRELIPTIEYIENFDIREGKIYKYYAAGGGNNRLYFTDYNAIKIDTYRQAIESIKKDIGEQKFFLLTSIIIRTSR